MKKKTGMVLFVMVLGFSLVHMACSNTSDGPSRKQSASIKFAESTVEKTTTDAAFINKLANTGDGVVTYESSNFAVATIDVTSGEVTIKGVGTATICASVSDGAKYYYDIKSVSYTLKVTETPSKTVILSTLTANTVVQNGYTITGTLTNRAKISIADGAAVTLKDVTINGVNSSGLPFAGLTCLGDATIILDGTNKVCGFHEYYPGIYVLSGKTLTIKGTGSLTVLSKGLAPGIGLAFSNIRIEGGKITATGGKGSAGIGSRRSESCGDITIAGGTVTVTGGDGGAGIGAGKCGKCGKISIIGGTISAIGGTGAAAIGCGQSSSNDGGSICQTITIANTVTKVTATKGDGSLHSIGKGLDDRNIAECGTVTVGGNIGFVETSPYTYPQ